MEIIILEFSTQEVFIYDIDKDQEVEDWICNNTDHDLGDIQYMVADEIRIHNTTKN